MSSTVALIIALTAVYIVGALAAFIYYPDSSDDMYREAGARVFWPIVVVWWMILTIFYLLYRLIVFLFHTIIGVFKYLKDLTSDMFYDLNC